MTAPRARPPAPLPRSLRGLLAEYRNAEDIPADVEDRIWSVVGADELAEGLEPNLDAVPPRRSRRRVIAWVGAAAAIAAALVAAWELGGQRAERERAGASPEAAVMHNEDREPGADAREVAPPASFRATPPSETVAEPPTDETSPGPSGPDEPSASDDSRASQSTSPVAPSRGNRARPPRAPDAPAPSPASSLDAERELVARAWRSLARGDEAAALSTAAEHRRRFDQGLLAPERDAIEVIARCRRGDPDGPRRAAAFHRAQPRSPLATRVDEACSPAEPSPEEDSSEP